MDSRLRWNDVTLPEGFSGNVRATVTNVTPRKRGPLSPNLPASSRALNRERSRGLDAVAFSCLRSKLYDFSSYRNG